MIFNLDVSTKAQEIVFSGKVSATNHGTVYFNNVPVIKENIQKHLGFFLDSKLNFFDNINEKIKKANEGINFIIIKKLVLITFFSVDNI